MLGGAAPCRIRRFIVSSNDISNPGDCYLKYIALKFDSHHNNRAILRRNLHFATIGQLLTQFCPLRVFGRSYDKIGGYWNDPCDICSILKMKWSLIILVGDVMQLQPLVNIQNIQLALLTYVVHLVFNDFVNIITHHKYIHGEHIFPL